MSVSTQEALALAIVDAVSGGPISLPPLELSRNADGSVDVTELFTAAAIAAAAIMMAAQSCSPFTEAELAMHARSLIDPEVGSPPCS